MAQSSVVSMKLLIDTAKAKRVLFAEAGKNCVDFLFHILSLPVASVIHLLQGQGMEGSLPNLYQSLENLDESYIQPNKTKDTFLRPVVPVSITSLPQPTLTYASTDMKFYGCHSCPEYGCNNCRNEYGYSIDDFYVSDDPSAVCPSCRATMTKALPYVEPPAVKVQVSGGGGLVKGVVTYMVMDDLVVKPMSTISTITLLNKFEIKELDALEEKVVSFGMNEAVKLLKASLNSRNVLTDVFC